MVKKKGQKSKKNAALSAAVESAEQEAETQMKELHVSDSPEPVDQSENVATACAKASEQLDDDQGQYFGEVEDTAEPADKGIPTRV